MVLITTETGSKYLLDMENRIWERTHSTSESGHLRATSAPFLSADYALGGHLVLICNSIKEGSAFRYIQTSRIIKIEEQSK